MAPANLIGAIKGQGFDYAMSAREVANNVAAGYQILYSEEVTFNTDADSVNKVDASGVEKVAQTSFIDAIANIFR